MQLPNVGAPFPINSNSLPGAIGTIVAPFMADVDNSIGDGRVWYRMTSDAALLLRAKSDIPVALSGENFNPKSLLIATWDKVGYYQQHIDKVCCKLVLCDEFGILYLSNRLNMYL